MDGHSYDSPEKKKWLKNKNRTLGNCPPTGIKTKKKSTNKIHWIVSKVALGIYYFAFLFVSYGVGMEAHAEHHAWIVADALNGLAGGVFFVYPFNIFRMNFGYLLDHWIFYIFISFFLSATAAVIGGNLGLGGFI